MCRVVTQVYVVEWRLYHGLRRIRDQTLPGEDWKTV